MQKGLVAIYSAVLIVGTLGTPASGLAGESAAHAAAITTSFGELTVEKVEIADRFPPACGEPGPMCSPAEPGYKVVMLWLEGTGDPSEAARALMNADGIHLGSAGGQQTDKFAGGMQQGKLFVAFTPPQAATGFVLHWPGNPPIPLEATEPGRESSAAGGAPATAIPVETALDEGKVKLKLTAQEGGAILDMAVGNLTSEPLRVRISEGAIDLGTMKIQSPAASELEIQPDGEATISFAQAPGWGMTSGSVTIYSRGRSK